MSNEIYGFADFSHGIQPQSLLNNIDELTPLGVFSVPKENLIGFPPDICPANNSLIFVIGDSIESMNAQYLLDFQDYDPEASIKLPTDAIERLSLATAVLSFFLANKAFVRMAVCLTVCNQIDSVKHVKSTQMEKVIMEDCAFESPPCILYVITP